MSAPLRLLCRDFQPRLASQALAVRQFTASAPAFARRKPKAPPVLSKKQLAAKAKKRALKAKSKNIYENEKMTLAQAINVLRAVEVASPNATYELTIKTAMPKGTAVPKGRIVWPREAKARTKDRILVFAEGKHAEEARNAGADIVGGPELIEGIISGRHKATTILCTPDLIRGITPKLGRVLGPLGLMPSERRGTVTEDVAGYIRRLAGSGEWRADKEGTVRAPVARMNWPVDDVVTNIRHMLTLVKRATGNIKDAKDKDKDVTVNPITRVVLASRQGPGITLSDH